MWLGAGQMGYMPFCLAVFTHTCTYVKIVDVCEVAYMELKDKIRVDVMIGSRLRTKYCFVHDVWFIPFISYTYLILSMWNS